MSNRPFVLIGCAILWAGTLISLARGQAATRPADPPWGEPVAGLQACLTVSGRQDRDYHPGEPLVIGGAVRNAASQALRVSSGESGLSSPYATLHARFPDGHEVLYIYDPGKRRDKPPRASTLVNLPPRGSVSILRVPMRMTYSIGGWLDATTLKPAELLSFRREGKYEFWLDYRVPPGDADVWTGSVVAPHLTLTVRELPPDQRQTKPTPEQLQALAKYLGSDTGHIPKEGTSELEQAIDRTENEGLALHLLDLADKDPEHRMNLLYFIQRRAGEWGSGEGIDGPYLKRYSDDVVAELESGQPKPARNSTYSLTPLGPLLMYLKLHPEDKDLHQRMIAVARKSANISSFPPEDTDLSRGRPRRVGANGPLFIGFPTAWAVLIREGVLRDGMTLEEAQKVLGPPTQRGGDWVQWYYNSTMHVNPGLSVRLRDGQLAGFAEAISRR